MTTARTIPTLAEIRGERLKRRQDKARTNLLDFTLYTFPGGGYRVNWHHSVTAAALDRFAAGILKRLIVVEPPRHGKTELAARRLPPLIFGHNPDARVMGGAYSAPLAYKTSRDIQRIMDTHEYFELFPETRLSGKHVATSGLGSYKRTTDEFEIVGRLGGYKCAGIGGSITGFGGGFLIIDDPVKNRAEADSPIFQARLWESYADDWSTRMEPPGCICVIATRWNLRDLVGQLLEKARTDPKADQWEVVHFPALLEGPAGPGDPRQLGEPLWIDRLRDPDEPETTTQQDLIDRTLADYDAIKARGLQGWTSLQQGEPVAKKGTIIQIDSMKQRYPYGSLDPHAPGEWLIYGDLKNGSKQPTSSYAVYQVWFKPTEHPARRYLVEQVRGRWDQGEEEQHLVLLCGRFWQVGPKKLENKADSAGVIVHLTDLIQGLIAIKAVPGSKADRLRACAHQFLAGNVYLPEGAPWLPEWIHEHTAFPGAANDDQVDTTSLALNDMATPTDSTAGWWQGLM